MKEQFNAAMARLERLNQGEDGRVVYGLVDDVGIVLSWDDDLNKRFSDLVALDRTQVTNTVRDLFTSGGIHEVA